MPSTSAHPQYPAPIPHIQHPYPTPSTSTHIPFPGPVPIPLTQYQDQGQTLIPSNRPSTGSMANTIPSTPQYLPSSSIPGHRREVATIYDAGKGAGGGTSPQRAGAGLQHPPGRGLVSKEPRGMRLPRAPSASWAHPGPSSASGEQLTQ